MINIDFSRWALNNHRLVALFIAILSLGGLLAYYVMPKLEDPEIVVRQAVVVGIYPGASSHQVELELTEPLEKSINKTGDLSFVQSYSYADMCYILVTLDPEVPADKLQLQLQSGKDSQQALIDASPSGLKPVTMASLTTVLGMIPLLFDDMFGSMAAAIMGGLIAGTIIVLIIIPVLYSIFYKLK